MKLISAKINNFRILKNVNLDFSINKEKPLTVIQAANETGKTTCLNALIWGLYGSRALPQRGDYSLFPSDIVDQKRVEVSVEIRFNVEHARGNSRGRSVLEKQEFALRRACFESAPSSDGQISRDNESAILYKITSEGTEMLSEDEARRVIETALPSELKDVYFTDGDSAMSFIEAAASQTAKRKRVADSIESLLGLKIVDQTVRHLGNVARQFSQQIDNTDYAKELERLNNHITSYEEDIVEAEDNIRVATLELAELNKEINEKEKQKDEILKLGDKSNLALQRNKIIDDIHRLSKMNESAAGSLLPVIYNDSASRMLLGEHIATAQNMLANLNRKKQLPQINLPILEELLGRSECFCGESLDPEVPEGNERRQSISNIIETSRQSDYIQEVATSLFYRLRSVNVANANEKWLDSYRELSSNVSNTENTVAKLQEQLEGIEAKINQIDDSQLQKINESLAILKRNAQSKSIFIGSNESNVRQNKDRLRDAEAERQKIRSKQGKTNSSLLNWDIADDVQKVFQIIIEKLKKEELKKVSQEMNRIFLSMIGSEEIVNELPQRIQRAELTEEYDIMVYGPNGHPLNPDVDLNGASRRAITLAFILALTKVSKVEAPNIIDTPLGMMSGYVKQSVLLRTIEEGSQVVLFLTHDEIRGVESIIDKYAGRFFTLTNPSHYPKMLVNKPETDDIGIMRCECYHNEVCHICERKKLEV